MEHNCTTNAHVLFMAGGTRKTVYKGEVAENACVCEECELLLM